MFKRMYSTKTKKLSTQKEVEEIDKICGIMILDKRIISHSNPWSAMWILNCIVYSAVMGWIIDGLQNEDEDKTKTQMMQLFN